MKRSLQFLLSLLCVCICFAPFSSSVYASDIDGYSVSTYYYFTSIAEKEGFVDKIVFDEAVSSFKVVVDITLNEPLERGTTFDFSSYVMTGQAESVSLSSLEMFDSDWNYAGVADVTFDGSLVEVLGAVNDARPCSYIRLTFSISNPQWVEGANTFASSFRIYRTESEGGGYELVTVPNMLTTFYATESGIAYKNNAGSLVPCYTYSGTGTFKGFNYNGTLVPVGSYLVCGAGTYLYAVDDVDVPGDPAYEFEFAVNSVSVTPVSTDGLLSGIIGWLRNIWNKLTALPGQIADSIVSGIKSLFVPDEDSFIAFKDSFSDLLSSRFGAVYESMSIMDSFFDSLKASSTNDTFTIPEVTINVGVPFKFGGWEVDIVPDKFDFLADACKWLISVAVTFFFVKGMRKRLEEVLNR